MCWFSIESENQIEDAKAGQRLGIKGMHWHSNWVVRETELDAPRPCPVCLIDRTRVLFRFSDGKQITLGDLPAGLIFDVLVVPGSEQLSAILDIEPAVQHEEEEREKEPLLVAPARFP